MVDRTRELLDRVDIGDVLARCSTAMDSRQWGLLELVFTPDAECDFGHLGGPQGLEEITTLIRSTIGDLDATQHVLSNLTVAVDGDGARADCYVVAHHVRGGTPGGDHYVVGGRYQDRLARTAGGWRIAHRSLHRLWVSGNRDVVRRAAGGRAPD